MLTALYVKYKHLWRADRKDKRQRLTTCNIQTFVGAYSWVMILNCKSYVISKVMEIIYDVGLLKI
jgi:hypothetical protein